MRMQRSSLSVPASDRRMIEKAAASEADAIFLDLEDSVVLEQKVTSRENVVWALRELDWGEKSVGYRVNGLDTAFFYRDLIEVTEQVADRLDMVLIPKTRSGGDVYTLDTLLAQIEMAVGVERGRVTLQAIIETANGLVQVEQIASSTPRLGALIFGPGDFSASMLMPGTNIGVAEEWDNLYPGHRFHYPMSRIVTAARAFGLLPIDGPVADFRNLEAFRRSCLIARSLGYQGKWCIHPAQISTANDVFMPTEDEVRRAREVVDRYEDARGAGVGAIAIDGVMIDVASIKMAEATLELASRASGSQGASC
jgi:citrate lyase beta subunit